MANLLSTCPACGGELNATVLHCADCGMELHNDFSLSSFDRLDKEQMDFLKIFLICQGNLKQLQEKMNISYPFAKKKLSLLLAALNLECEPEPLQELSLEEIAVDPDSTKASDIIKGKLIACGGVTNISLLSGKTMRLHLSEDGKSFICSELPITPPYRFDVFDLITEHLLSQGGKARKGNGRSAKLGEKGCELDTVMGVIGSHYAGKSEGQWVFDPVFALSAILEWADIAYNKRGYLELTAQYMAGGK